MGVVLPPLEFTECLSDSPYFRENLHKHERELEKTNQQIKRITKEVKDLLTAAKRLKFRWTQKALEGFFKLLSSAEDDSLICLGFKHLLEWY
ncbi:hypothetical protein HUJ05_000124 [Dendroctonus ponderosae]|nr:hypothetical protein HUJ05_000124 [Dendroctonus ponderosae]